MKKINEILENEVMTQPDDSLTWYGGDEIDKESLQDAAQAIKQALIESIEKMKDGCVVCVPEGLTKIEEDIYIHRQALSDVINLIKES